MRFAIRWADSALNELAATWTAADSAARALITSAARLIDQHLETDPEGTGESRSEGERIVFVYPLGAAFRVEAGGRTVSVLHVWRFYRKND